jgi:hypothetical protein
MDQGAKFMADVIKNNSILTRLDLSFNSIGNVGIKGSHTSPLLPHTWELAGPSTAEQSHLWCVRI